MLMNYQLKYCVCMDGWMDGKEKNVLFVVRRKMRSGAMKFICKTLEYTYTGCVRMYLSVLQNQSVLCTYTIFFGISHAHPINSSKSYYSTTADGWSKL